MTAESVSLSPETWGLIILISTGLAGLFITTMFRLGTVKSRLDHIESLVSLSLKPSDRSNAKAIALLRKRYHPLHSFVAAHEGEIAMIMEKLELARVRKIPITEGEKPKLK